MRTNTTKAKLAEGKVVFGAIISRHAPDLVELFRAAARHGYRVLTSGRVGGAKFLAEQYADIVAAFAAERVPLVAEIDATRPVHVCFSFKVGDTPHRAAMRSMELMIGEVKPRVEKTLGAVAAG